MATNVKVYTTEYCPFCLRAKKLLTERGIPFEEINLEGKPDELAALKARTGFRTVPQIFIKDHLIGGYTDLAALDQAGKLDDMVK
ncbi:MAG TPA: glutaredoxin 3 [Bdellovibrionales bacterium]|nr:glutaredoxin 3 [Bdellovibrionales bacterium]